MTSPRRKLSPALGAFSVVGIMAAAISASAGRPAPKDDPQAARSRRPIALAIVDDGATLLVANGRSGTISEIDLKSLKVVSENEVARGLNDLVSLGGSDLAAIDQVAGELLLLKHRPGSVSVESRLRIGSDPIHVARLLDGMSCAVTSRWSRRLDIIDMFPINVGRDVRIRKSIELPFPPREVLPIDGGRALLVADAFGGKIAVVKAADGDILSVRQLPAHNLRGLALTADGSRVMIAHQATSRLATSSFDDVHWGALMKNQVLTLKVDALLDPKADVMQTSSTRDLDDVGHAAGDPEDIAIGFMERTIVALAGVGEVVILGERGSPNLRVPVGTRPCGLAISPDGHSIYAADAEEDTVAAYRFDDGPARAISLGPKPAPTAIERGGRLFSSAKLSHQGWMSCRSCHAEGHTTGIVADTLGDGSYGAPKLVPSLLGVGSTGPWGWLGNFATLEDQVRSSVETTMHGASPSAEQVADLTAYLKSLKPLPGPSTGGEAATRGAELFRSKKCASCHAGAEFTSEGVRDVGLTDEVGHREFNPPSLRGVAHRARFLHDGRAGSLDAVFSEHRHPPGSSLSASEVADLIAYLKTL